MTGVGLLAAASAATAAFLIVRAVVGVPLRLATRIAPYTQRSRQRLGTVEPATTGAPTRSIWGPLLSALARGIATVADAGQSGQLERRLRNAGLGHLSVEDYRRRQLASTAAGAGTGLVLAALLRLDLTLAFVMVTGCAFIGLTRWRSRLDHRTEERRTRMQAEAHVICQLLAIYLRTGDTPQGALDRLCARADGVIPGELTAATGLIRSGAQPVDTLEQLAADTAEPAAARLYRLYGATWTASGDPTALMALAEVLRSGRRDALARTMAKRRTAMVLPLVMVIGPILLLFIAAAIPTIVLGR